MISIYLQMIWSFFRNIKWTPLKISIIINIIFAGIIYFLMQPGPIVEPDIIVEEKIITIPGKEGKLDTIYYPEPYYVKNPINTELLKKYESLKDSISKKELFKEVIAEKEYNETYEDSLVKIDVYTKVQGKLLKQSPMYFIKPSEVKYNDTTTIITMYQPKIKLYGGLELGHSINTPKFNPILKANLLLQNKKENIWSVSYDTEEIVWIGHLIKF